MDEQPDVPDAQALRERLAEPIFNSVIKRWVGKGELDYELYLRTGELLALQTRNDELVAPEEMLFQIVHQTQELWLKLMAHEAIGIVDALDHDDLWAASGRIERMARVGQVLAVDLRVIEALPPDTFLTIRRHLGNGSGMQSPGYNQTMLAADAVDAALSRLLERRGTTLAEVYREGARPGELHRICEQLLDVDHAFQWWLGAHLLLVRRTIGVDTSVVALDGMPTKALIARSFKPLFRQLWEVRVELTGKCNRGGGYPPGEDRAPPQAPLREGEGGR